MPTFLMAPLLLGVLAAGIPVLIHLLHRQRTTPLQWGAMQFLLESPLQLKRRRTIDHWLLMLLRMALLALLAVLLARPVGCPAAHGLLGAVATDYGIVIDNSLSTARHGAQSTLFAEEIAAVEKLAEGLKPDDTLSIVLAGHRPQRLTPMPVSGRQNLAKLVQDLHQLKPGSTDGPIPEAVQAARTAIAQGRNGRKAILVLSDEQRSGWRIDNTAAWKLALGTRVKGVDDLKLYAMPVAPAAPASDVAVGDVTIWPAVIGQDRPAQITATLTNSGPKDVGGLNARFVVDGKTVDIRPVPPLPAGQSRTIRFEHTFKDAGSNWVKVQADVADALDADNAATVAANVWQRLSVLIVDGELTSAGKFKSSQFLLAAMQPVADPETQGATLVQPKLVSVSDASTAKLEDYQVVVLNDVPQLPSELTAKLADYARAGHAVWFILGPRSEPQFIAKDVADAGLFAAEVKKQETAGPAAPPIEVRDPQHPSVALLCDAGRNAMTGAVTKQWWSLAPADPDHQVILATAGGDPLVFERPLGRNGGRVVVWTTSVDRAWNNWPALPSFVPLVNETLYHLASSQARGLENRRLDAGQPIIWSGPATPAIKTVYITRPDETRAEVHPLVSNGRCTFSYSDTFTPGLYEARFDPTDVPQPVYFGVGVDRKELDNTALSTADLTWLKDRGYLEARVEPGALVSTLGGPGAGEELWKTLGLFLLATLVLETVMTYRMVRLQSQVDVARAGLLPAATT